MPWPFTNPHAALDRRLGALGARHKEASVIASLDDETARPSARLIDVAIAAANAARGVDLRELDLRTSGERRWYQTWPGEHYRLLAGLVQVLNAKTVIEIGTFTGMGTLALAHGLPSGGRVVTFDLAPWSGFAETWLAPSDFANGRVEQIIANLADGVGPHRALFQSADFIFIDGPKDGATERRFIDALGAVDLPRDPIVMFDDIRVLNMVEIWRALKRPKMDLTSFGHWSGTGLVDWNGRP